ncbi:MAG: single-stranded DNA-binding protein [Candidatus Eisenbacteria bacterium]
MSSVNKVIIVGNLGKDPELKFTQSGVAVCNFSVATSEKWTTKEGETNNRTEWHRVTAWKAQAEACAKYLAKGSKVYVEGKLQTREWEKNGEKRYTTEIMAQSVVFLSMNGGQDEAAGGGAPAAVAGAAADWQATGDDLPF